MGEGDSRGNSFPGKALIGSLMLATLLLPAVAAGTDSAMQQIRALYQEKQNRSPAQAKIDSHLLRMQDTDGYSIRPVVVPLRNHLSLDASGRIEIDITARVDADLLAVIERLDGVVINSVPRFDSVRAKLPLRSLETLAEDPDVVNIRPADQYMLQMINTTEGDVAHAADTARTLFQVDGTGTLVCAMSDSVDSLADLQASGDLPPGVTVLPGQSGNPGTSEGTALLEIIFASPALLVGWQRRVELDPAKA